MKGFPSNIPGPATLRGIEDAIAAAMLIVRDITHDDIQAYWTWGMDEGDALALLKFTAFQALWNARVAADEAKTARQNSDEGSNGK